MVRRFVSGLSANRKLSGFHGGINPVSRLVFTDRFREQPLALSKGYLAAQNPYDLQ